MIPAASGNWWQPRPVLRRFVTDLLEGELARQRRCAIGIARPWPEDLRFEEDLGVDSLELMVLATALAQALHLHESGIEDSLLARRSLGDWVDIAQQGLERFNERITFRTSGSSGDPKGCAHSLQGLLQETGEHARQFAGRHRILAAVPSHHIYGFLFSVLLPGALGLDDQAVIDLRGSTPAWLARGAQAGDLVVGHPDFWQAVASTVPAIAPGVVGVTSTGPCPAALSESIAATGLDRLVDVYGSSEAAGIGWRDSPLRPYQLFPYLAFSPDNPAQLVRLLPDGSRRAFECQDDLQQLDAGRFRVGQRLDAAVQVAGINVFAARVAAVLERHPLVDRAAVRLMRPDEGSRLKAYLVPRGVIADTDAFLAELRRWIDSALPAHERPKALRLGTQLPVGQSGKAADWEP